MTWRAMFIRPLAGVRDYETWFAFEKVFTVGSAAGGGEAGRAATSHSLSRSSLQCTKHR